LLYLNVSRVEGKKEAAKKYKRNEYARNNKKEVGEAEKRGMKSEVRRNERKKENLISSKNQLN